MKKLLLVTTAIAGVALMSAQANAAVKLDLGGAFQGYGVASDNNIANERGFELRRLAEIYVSGETTLKNGLTLGAATETEIANGDTSITMTKVNAFLSGNWGRVNFGVEDGAASLLQVEAPSADANIDGMAQNIHGIGASKADLHATALNTDGFDTLLDYDHSDFTTVDRLTYITPKFSGAQLAVSYTPTNSIASSKNAMATKTAAVGAIDFNNTDTAGGANTVVLTTDVTAVGSYENLWEAAFRYDREIRGHNLSLGAGYSTSSLITDPTLTDADSLTGTTMNIANISDGIETYNVGINLEFNGFSLGGNYMIAMSEYATDVNTTAATTTAGYGDIERATYVIGAAYDNGPYHFGLSYLNQNSTYDAIDAGAAGPDAAVTVLDIPKQEYEADKFTIGGGYEFGPGMNLRGSVAWGEFADKTTVANSNDFQQVALGLDIQF